MAIDLAAIRKRVQELNGQRRTSSVQLWKPDAGEYKVRGVPWKSTPDGMPFIERRFYYLGDSPRILAPTQFGKPDPINDLIRKLYSTRSPDDRELAKKLQPKMTAYMAIIVRGQEDKGVQVWSFNKFIYQRLLGFFTDEEVGDILDPMDGFDLKVIIKPSGKKFNGKDVMDTVVDASRRPSKLHEDPEVAKKWLDNIPNIDDMYQQKTTAEIEQALNNWLAGDGSGDDPVVDEGTGRGLKPQDELEKLVNEVKSEVKTAPKAEASKPAPTPKKQPPKKAASDVDLEEPAPAVKQSLDDAFADLMSDSDD